MKCWRCQGLGHITSQCPNQRAMLVLPSGKIVIDDEEEYKDMPPLVVSQEEIPTDETVGLGLVTRRALVVHLKEENAQRENIFYTRCHIKDKVCSQVIDPGSCVNVASMLMVEMLGLETHEHSKPY